MTSLREAAQQALEALAIGQDAAHEVAQTYHEAMAGYRPARHIAVDDDVRKIEDAITALRAALVEDAMQKFTDVNQELEAALAEKALHIDTLSMAREAGFAVEDGGVYTPDAYGPGNVTQLVKRFADLVAAAEQDRCCKIIYSMAGSDNVAQRTVDAIRGKQ